jgi:hypothetical protein
MENLFPFQVYIIFDICQSAIYGFTLMINLTKKIKEYYKITLIFLSQPHNNYIKELEIPNYIVCVQNKKTHPFFRIKHKTFKIMYLVVLVLNRILLFMFITVL